MKETSSWVFFVHKHSISLGQKVERKHLFSEECTIVVNKILSE